MSNSIYCALAFGSASINSYGEYIPCCNIQTTKWSPLKDSKNKHLLLLPPKDRINAPNLKEIREKLIAGEWPEACINCKSAEENGVGSMRTIWNRGLGDTIPEVVHVSSGNIKYLDLTFSTKCNSKCMTCSADLSDFWEEEWKTIWIKDENKYPIKRVCINDTLAESLVNDFPNVEKIALIGGEPMISEEHIKFLKLLVEKNRSKNIGLSYVTNLTGITDELIDIWKNFKSVHVSVSIDGYKQVNEYIRYPFKWSKTESNLRKFLDMVADTQENYDYGKTQFTIGLSCTVSLFNAYYVSDLFKFWYELLAEYGEIINGNSVAKSCGCFVNRVSHPEYALVSMLSDDFRNKSVIKLKALLSQITDDIKENPGKEVNHGFIESIKLTIAWLEEKQTVDIQQNVQNKYFIVKSDKVRNRHIKDFMPELYEELKTNIWSKIPRGYKPWL